MSGSGKGTLFLEAKACGVVRFYRDDLNPKAVAREALNKIDLRSGEDLTKSNPAQCQS